MKTIFNLTGPHFENDSDNTKYEYRLYVNKNLVNAEDQGFNCLTCCLLIKSSADDVADADVLQICC